MNRREKVLDFLRQGIRILDKAIELDSSDEKEPIFIPEEKYEELKSLRHELVILLYWLKTISYPRR